MNCMKETLQRAGFFALTLLLVGVVGCDKGEADATSGANSGTESPEPQETQEAEQAGGAAAIGNGGITAVPQDDALADKGKKVFKSKGCAACHKMEKKLVGPALSGVTERRDAEWLAKMILHPDEMLKHDETAKKLLAEHMTPMPNQGVTPEEAKAIIAYLGTQK